MEDSAVFHVALVLVVSLAAVTHAGMHEFRFI